MVGLEGHSLLAFGDVKNHQFGSLRPTTDDTQDKLEAIHSAVEAKLILRPLNFVEEAARPKPLAVATLRIPGPEVQSRARHMLIIPRYEKYIAEWWLPSCAG
ncbi:hypothetical protein EVAR_83135_1 [Eumeta japonica]|uniref:Uncharacterized protein n=1 Tax=Eumeta variegata TaxID=151549 RepID=A0A4C1YE63_EUMVA|nr:hypothetical protein EVAR_83135_1 [Eumeta japonica]